MNAPDHYRDRRMERARAERREQMLAAGIERRLSRRTQKMQDEQTRADLNEKLRAARLQEHAAAQREAARREELAAKLQQRRGDRAPAKHEEPPRSEQRKRAREESQTLIPEHRRAEPRQRAEAHRQAEPSPKDERAARRREVRAASVSQARARGSSRRTRRRAVRQEEAVAGEKRQQEIRSSLAEQARVARLAQKESARREMEKRGQASSRAAAARREQSAERERGRQQRQSLRDESLARATQQAQAKAARAAIRQAPQQAGKDAEIAIARRTREKERRLAARQTRKARREQRAAVLWRFRVAGVEEALGRRSAGRLPGLKTEGNRIHDRNGKLVRLRGVNIRGFDSIAFLDRETFRRKLGLDHRNLAVLGSLWETNLVRVVFHPPTLMRELESSGGVQRLEALDEIVQSAAQAGIYVLLAAEERPRPEAQLAQPGEIERCWTLLAERYRQQGAVLYGVDHSAPVASPRPAKVSPVIAAIRKANPGSLVFAAETHAPMRSSSGSLVPNLVCSTRLAPSHPGSVSMLQSLAQLVPVFIPEWSENSFGAAHFAHLGATLLERLGAGWAASAWNEEPRLVRNAEAHDFTPTPFGLVVKRAAVRAAHYHAAPIRLP